MKQGGALPSALLLPTSFTPIRDKSIVMGKGGLQTTDGLFPGSI